MIREILCMECEVLSVAIYRTRDLARMAKVHPNTVRLYEKYGLLSPVPRDTNGYRRYDQRHIVQIRVCRAVYSHPWVGTAFRHAFLAIIRSLIEWDLTTATQNAESYLRLLEKEYQQAERTAQILQRWTQSKGCEVEAPGTYSRKQAAEIIGSTPEALRNWERNGLITVPRVDANGSRRYGRREMERLRIIYMLRQSQYSMSAIARSLAQYDKGYTAGVLDALHNPVAQDEVSWVLAGDRWLDALAENIFGAKQVIELLNEASSCSLQHGADMLK